jgi:hypothetical protein
VVKVDFDLTMTILAHNLYRLLASELSGYSHNRAQSLYDTFLDDIYPWLGHKKLIFTANTHT